MRPAYVVIESQSPRKKAWVRVGEAMEEAGGIWVVRLDMIPTSGFLYLLPEDGKVPE